MEKQIQAVTKWLKEQPIRGCITGSSLLGYFPDSNQDVDIFMYDDKTFTRLLYTMYFNDMFQILDDLEDWKLDQYLDKVWDNYKKQGLVTIKFTYNTCVPVNIILKKGKTNIFSVISSFDMDIVAKGYDIQTKQILDLTGDSIKTKIASWNRWNTEYDDPELWETRRLLRQLTRVFKYYNRGYNTDPMMVKYIEVIKKAQKYKNIFDSNSFTERLKITKKNLVIVEKICELWLETHSINKKEIDLLNSKIKNL